jgi:hypothetical protein
VDVYNIMYICTCVAVHGHAYAHQCDMLHSLPIYIYTIMILGNRYTKKLVVQYTDAYTHDIECAI